MKTVPEISVVIPIYNVEKYLPRCLNSLLSQTFENFEAICVNDGSSDTCSDILKAFSKKDKRIKVITQQNQGLSMARNNGLKAASGKYVYFLDSDDCIHPRLLECVYYFAQKYQADVVTFGYIKQKHKFPPEKCEVEPSYFTIKNIEKISHKCTHMPLKYCTDRGRYKINYNAWTKLYKRQILNGIEFIPNICFEDYPHTLSVLMKAPLTVILRQDLYYYTENPSSISNTSFNIKHIDDYHAGLNAVYDIFSRKGQKEFDFVLKEIIPKILKHQLNRILRSPKEKQTALFDAFTKELVDLDNKGCIRFRGNKLTRYLKYRKLIKKVKHHALYDHFSS